MRALLRWLLACAVLVVTNAFTLLPLAPRDAMTAAPGLKNHARAVLPLRMVDKALFERGDAKCVAIIKAIDQLQVAITGELTSPASDLVPAFITIKNRIGLVGKSYAREKALAKEAEEKKREFVAQGRIPRGEGGRLW